MIHNAPPAASMFFSLPTGRLVEVQQFLVKKTSIGVFEGHPDSIRSLELEESKRDAAMMLGAASGFLLFEPNEGRLPPFRVCVDLTSAPLVQDDYTDFSRLVCCWFDHMIPSDIYAYFSTTLQSVQWELYAKDSGF